MSCNYQTAFTISSFACIFLKCVTTLSCAKKIPVFFQKSRKLRLSLVSMQKICRYGPGRKVPIVVDGNDLEVLNDSADDGWWHSRQVITFIHQKSDDTTVVLCKRRVSSEMLLFHLTNQVALK